MSKKKNKVKKITEEQFSAYIAALQEKEKNDAGGE